MFGLENQCPRIRRLLSDRIDGPLSARAERKVVSHLEKCFECREEYVFYRDLKENAALMEKTAPPPYLWERISLAIDEHPWGEEEGFSMQRRRRAEKNMTGKINWAGALISMALVAVLGLSPGGVSHESRLTQPSTSRDGMGRDIEYISLYLMANQDHYPAEVRDYYLNHMEGLNQKIETIKSTLERYPQNSHIKAQLAMAYKQKIDLYEEIGLARTRGGGTAQFAAAFGDVSFKGRRYE